MAVSKRTRFEVLRRDGHACRYCGATAPDVKLTVDHVTPVALGGTDDPSNLVTACAGCNSGKASTSPDSSLVADVKDDALRYAELTRQAYAVLVQTMGERDVYASEFFEAYRYELPDDWRNSLGRWFDMGVPIELILDAAQTANTKPQTFRGTGRFTYMCGIVWNQAHLVGEQVAQRAALDGSWLTDDDRIDLGIDSYMRGLDRGRAEVQPILAPSGVLEDFIDRSSVEPRPSTVALMPWMDAA